MNKNKFYKTLDAQAKKIVDSYFRALQKVGYKPRYNHYICNEISKQLNPKYEPKRCKECKIIQFVIAKKYYINEKPANPRLCVECAGLDKTAKVFKPKMLLKKALEKCL